MKICFLMLEVEVICWFLGKARITIIIMSPAVYLVSMCHYLITRTGIVNTYLPGKTQFEIVCMFKAMDPVSLINHTDMHTLSHCTIHCTLSRHIFGLFKFRLPRAALVLTRAYL